MGDCSAEQKAFATLRQVVLGCWVWPEGQGLLWLRALLHSPASLSHPGSGSSSRGWPSTWKAAHSWLPLPVGSLVATAGSTQAAVRLPVAASLRLLEIPLLF